MGWTKRQFVEQAFAEIGLAGYVFDLSPEQLQTALRQLDSMMAVWNAKGIRLGYPVSLSPQDSDLDTDTAVPLESAEAIYLNLALRIAPGFGKSVQPETRANAKAAYDTLLMRAAFPAEQQLNGSVPAGAGSRREADEPFLNPPDDAPLGVQDNGQLQFLGD